MPGAALIGEEAVMPDAVEAAWQHVDQESPEESPVGSIMVPAIKSHLLRVSIQ